MAVGGAGIKFRKSDRRAAVNKKKKMIAARKQKSTIKKLRRAAKDESVKKRYKRAPVPHIPNKWPHKYEMLVEIAKKREATRLVKGKTPSPSVDEE